MQMHLLNDKHRAYLRDIVGVEPDIFEKMTYQQLDKLVDDKLMWLECDGVDDTLPGGINEEGKLAAELIDIIYGPYEDSWNEDFVDLDDE